MTNSAIERTGFGETSVERRNETATSAVAAQAQASIQARYVMALQRPRDFDNVRVRLLKECERSNFAEQALYSIPRGDKPGKITGTPNRLEGLTVRFAESVIRLAGNLATSTRTVYDDDHKRLLTVSVTDLETNAVYERDIVLQKTIERKKPADREIISQRLNTAGDTVYIVACTEDELLAKEGAIVSKTFRTLALRFLPADIIDECVQTIATTRSARVRKDPEAARKAVVDAFATLGVMPANLKLYLGHDIASCSPAELEGLRGLFEGIREGEITWAAVIAEKNAPADDGANSEAKDKPKAAALIADRVKARAQAKAKEAPAKASPATSNALPCSICKLPVTGAGVSTMGDNGVAGIRHQACDPVAKKAVPRDAYLPPRLRGDAYDGPDSPEAEPPSGAQ